jgi:hypothetical protein
MSFENVLYRNKQVKQFIDRIREKDVACSVRELCLIGIEVFQYRNPTMTHFSLNEIQRCLHNFVEESREIAFNKINKEHNEKTPEKRQMQRNHISSYPYFRKIDHKNHQSHGNFNRDKELDHNHAKRSHSRKSRRQEKQPTYYSTQSDSPDRSPSSESSDEGIEIRDPNLHPKAGRSKNNNGVYYYNRVPPSHSSNPADPENNRGPPIQVAPYYYLTDKDIGFVSGEKEPKRFVTTVDRLGGNNASNSNSKNATTPLKSCMQKVEVKIARGGVAVSFDPWSTDTKGPIRGVIFII